MPLTAVHSKAVVLLSLTHLLLPLKLCGSLLFYFSFVLYYAVLGLVIILCFCAIGCLTGCALLVASVFLYCCVVI